MSKYKEIDLTRVIKERPVHEAIIFNNDPTLNDIEEAFNNDQIIIFNNAVKNLDSNTIESFIESIPDDHRNNIAIFFIPMKQEQFEKYIIDGFSKNLFSDLWVYPKSESNE